MHRRESDGLLVPSVPMFAPDIERLRLRNALELTVADRPNHFLSDGRTTTCRFSETSLESDERYSRVVTVTSQSGMARVMKVSTTLSRPVSTNSPIHKKAAPIRGLPMRNARAIQSRRAMMAWRDP